MTAFAVPDSLTQDETRAGARCWFALVVKTRHERFIGTQLQDRQFEVLVPTYRVRKRRGSRYRLTEDVLFPSYVFCRFDYKQRLPVLMTPGVRTVVSTSDGPLSLMDEEIEALRALMRSKLECEPYPWMRPGQMVEITSGPLKGVAGSIVQVSNGYRLILSVTGLYRSVAVRIDSEHVSPILHGVTSHEPRVMSA